MLIEIPSLLLGICFILLLLIGYFIGVIQVLTEFHSQIKELREVINKNATKNTER